MQSSSRVSLMQWQDPTKHWVCWGRNHLKLNRRMRQVRHLLATKLTAAQTRCHIVTTKTTTSMRRYQSLLNPQASKVTQSLTMNRWTPHLSCPIQRSSSRRRLKILGEVATSTCSQRVPRIKTLHQRSSRAIAKSSWAPWSEANVTNHLFWKSTKTANELSLEGSQAKKSLRHQKATVKALEANQVKD